MKRWYLAIGAVAILGAAIFGAVNALRHETVTRSEGDWGDFFDADSLVEASQLIVVAELVSTSSEEIVFQSPTNPDAKFVRTDQIQVFKVFEVVKGTYAEDKIERRATLGHDFQGDSAGRGKSTLQDVPIEPGRRFVLFLAQYPVDDTRVGWSSPGDPAVAEVEGDRLIFRGTARYGQAVEELGLAKASARSEAPFEMTLSQLKAR